MEEEQRSLTDGLEDNASASLPAGSRASDNQEFNMAEAVRVRYIVTNHCCFDNCGPLY